MRFALVIALLCTSVVVIVVKWPEGRFPDKWDARIAPLVAFVEQQKHGKFIRPVHVDLLSDGDFRKQARNAFLPERGSHEQEELERTAAVFQALGLMREDLQSQLRILYGEGLVGYYAPRDNRVRLRGRFLTPGVRVTLVHELTHVWQDQHPTGDGLDEDATNGQIAGLTAVLEGDATLVERAYLGTLSESEQQAVTDDDNSNRDAQPTVPAVLESLFDSPYVLGPPLIEIVATGKPEIGRDGVLRNPPRTHAQIFDPWRYLDDEGASYIEPVAFEENDVPIPGQRADFGALMLYLMLGQRIDAKQAFQAADGWGGDTFEVFKRDEATCARMTLAGDTPANTRAIETALERWRRAVPAATAKISAYSEGVHFESCDAPTADPRSSDGDLLALPALRSTAGAELIVDGTAPAVARCAATGLVRSLPTPTLLGSTRATLHSPSIQRTLRQLVTSCSRTT
ncbi:MAG: hypothetical protein QOG53_3622 [Frankiales bacterium]|nr:hypothetical protein [Frankiales bacterium]